MMNKEKIKNAFYKVRKKGWVKSHRKHNTGIGKTFEDCIGVIENNINEPDLYGFEIKAHRSKSSSFITLFTKSPSYPRKGANAYLKDKFGTTNPQNNFRELHTSIFANKYNTYHNQYSFKLIHKPEKEKIFIGVFSLGENVLLDSSVYYTYQDLRLTFNKKLHNLFYVKAQHRTDENGDELFLYQSAEIFMNPTFNKFLELLDNGEIMYDVRIGTYKSGNKIGKPHDHGSGFRIMEKNLQKLYSYCEIIE